MYKNKRITVIMLIGTLALLVSGCATPAAAFSAGSSAESGTPETIVESFYNWYLETIDRQEDGSFHNVLVEGDYRSSPYLTDELKSQLDTQVSGGLLGDPLLCAQDIPQSFTVGTADLAPQSNEARVPVETSFEGHHFVVWLQQVEGQWLIGGVICG